MSGSVTPARRQRDVDEPDGEGSEVSMDGKRKRTRTSPTTVNSESPATASPVLPDSFRRSPRSSVRSPDGVTNGHAVRTELQKHAPGSIVRVTLTNFVTYTKAEFQPGPNLNMIIGPNGTGKSTLVCAICLGLGWATSHLGRAKDLGEFVKHGSKRAQIEVELAADPTRHTANPIITTRITREGNKAEYLIGSKKSNRKGVQELARSFSIQVDNLCQFLPQDRVVEFAALSPVDLLTHTQRAAAPEYMSDWHDELKRMRKSQKEQQVEQQRDLEILKHMENRQRGQDGDVERLRERSGLQDRVAALEKLRPFAFYNDAREKHKEASTRKKEAVKELRQLENRVQPNLKATEAKQAYSERIDKVVIRRRNVVERTEKSVAELRGKLSAHEDKIQECIQDAEAEKNSIKTVRQSVPRLKQAIVSFEREMQTPPAAFDPAEMNEQIREKTRRIREIEEKGKSIKEEMESLSVQAQQRKQLIENAQRERESLQSQIGQQVSKLKHASRDAARAWDWIQEHRDQFHGQVFGPSIIECTVKDPRHAAAVETMIPDGDKMAFTVTSQQDMKMLLDQFNGEMRLHDVHIRVSPGSLDSFRPSMSTAELQQLGLDGWLLDLIEGPEAVLAMLCDNRNIHQTAYATREISEAQFTNVQRSSISSWVTPTQSYQINRRREYGDKATSTRVQALRQARFFTDAPVDRQMEHEIDARVREAEGEIDALRERREELKAQGTPLGNEGRQLIQDKKDIEEEKSKKQRALSEFNGLGVKKARAETNLREAMDSMKSYRERQYAIIIKSENLYLAKGQLALDYATAVEGLRAVHVQLYEMEIMQIEANSDLQRLRAQHAEELKLLQERRREVELLTAQSDKLFADGRRLGQQCQELGVTLTNFENNVHQEISVWKPDQLQTETESVQARLEMHLGGPNENILREYEKRARQIEEKRASLSTLNASLEELEGKIDTIRQQWEPQLDALIAEISAAFAENFSRIQCAGEVAVYKDEDFEQWAVQIKVKFR